VLRPAVALPALAVIVLIVALFTPEPVERGRGDVSTFSRAESGGRLAYDFAGRLGWRVGRRLSPLDTPTAAHIVHVVLAPREDLGAGETHRLLESVRRGGALIASLDEGSTLSDSLRIAAGQLGRFVGPDGNDGCTEAHERRGGIFATPPVVTSIAWHRPAPPDLMTFATIVVRQREALPAVVGFGVSAGRVVLVSDAELFTNDVIRVCDWQADVVLSRALAYVKDGRGIARTTLVFDEYHHGYGTHPGSVSAIGQYIARTPSGHLFAQLVLAGLVLLLAIAPRPIVPRDPERIVRRSPLEHADALAHAYAEAGAERTAVARLVEGVRRRVGRAAGGTASNESFLNAVAGLRPTLSDDVNRVRAALNAGAGAGAGQRELAAVGASLHRIEQSLTPTGGG
jgi:hypothetical protein